MEVKCILKTSRGVLKDKNKVYPEALVAPRKDANAVLKEIEQNCQVQSHKVEEVLSALSKVLEYNLQSGHSVEIPSLGTFTMTVKGKVEQDEKGTWNFSEKPKGKIKFRPSRKMHNVEATTKFVLANHHSVMERPIPTDEEALRVMRQLQDKYGFFIPKSFCDATNTTDYQAKKIFGRLLAEGKIIKQSYKKTCHYRVK